MQHRSHKVNERAIHSLGNSVLLWGVCDSKLVGNSIFQQMLFESVGDILSTVVCTEGFDLFHSFIGSADDVEFVDVMTGVDLGILVIDLKVFE